MVILFHPGAEENQDYKDFIGFPYVFAMFNYVFLCFFILVTLSTPYNTVYRDVGKPEE